MLAPRTPLLATKDWCSCLPRNNWYAAYSRVNLCTLQSLRFPHLASPAGPQGCACEHISHRLVLSGAGCVTRCPAVGQTRAWAQLGASDIVYFPAAEAHSRLTKVFLLQDGPRSPVVNAKTHISHTDMYGLPTPLVNGMPSCHAHADVPSALAWLL